MRTYSVEKESTRPDNTYIGMVRGQVNGTFFPYLTNWLKSAVSWLFFCNKGLTLSRSYITDAICLKTHDFSESSQVLHLLSSDQGAVRAVAKGIKRPKSRLAGATHLFQVSTFQCVRGKTLDTVAQYRPVESFSLIGSDLLASGLACGCADVLRWAVPEHDPHCEEAFEIFRTYLQQINQLLKPGVGLQSSLFHLFKEYQLNHSVTHQLQNCWTGQQRMMVALTVDGLLKLSDSLGLGLALDECAVCHSAVPDDGQPKRFSIPLHGVVHGGCQSQAEEAANHTAGWARLAPATWSVLQAPLTDAIHWLELGETPLSPLRFVVYYLSSVLEHKIPAFDVAFAMHA